MTIRVLIVEDADVLRNLLVRELGEFYETHGVPTAEAALELAQRFPFALAVVDVNLPKMSGLTLISKLLELIPALPIISVSGEGTIEMAVEAMRLGARDFLVKPFSFTSLLDQVALAVGQPNPAAAGFPKVEVKPDTMIAEAPVMRALLQQVAAVAPFLTNVLVTGETGTGKEVLVRCLHHQSQRSDKPFVALNCAAIPEHLLEDELFGHVKGAFTGAVAAREGRFAAAAGGTLFLDEIGDLSLSLQAKLLRVLQERVYEKVGCSQPVKADVRILAATSVDLEHRVQEKTFRSDLFYRLNVVRFHLPPLRQRAEDIPALAQYFLDRFCQQAGLPPKEIAAEVWPALWASPWPGNIRQLQNVMERAAVLTGCRRVIALRDLPGDLQAGAGHTGSGPTAGSLSQDPPATNREALIPAEGISFESVISGIERELLYQTLVRTQGNKMQAARLLNLKRTTLVEKLKRLDLTEFDQPPDATLAQSA